MNEAERIAAMNEAETRAELIDQKLKNNGWGVVDGSRVLRERDVCSITTGKINPGGSRGVSLFADYILVYRGVKLAVVEAKSIQKETTEGVAQAKLYAQKLSLGYTYSTNGKEIYQICMKTGAEKEVENFLTPDELWSETYGDQNEWRDRFLDVGFEDKSGTWRLRYYQEIAINKTLEAIAQNQKRILLTLATGTGKTSIAFQISWKLFHAHWNIQKDIARPPRILFLSDRNILSDQAYNQFSAFDEDAMVRIKPNEIRKKGKVPTNGNIFFTIFQTFMSGKDSDGEATPYFGEYPKDYFDFIIIDECHRGGANDQSSWREILDYFSPAVQLGLTATPKKDENIDTYEYFGEPVYIYSLKDGIDDGFLTPFKLKRITTTIDDYIYTDDDTIIQGEIEQGKNYEENDFNKIIEIKDRERKRVEIFMDDIDQDDKTIVFCATQKHAGMIRDMINQYKKSKHTDYCVRVTADDGSIGDQFLRTFQDNEKMIPTILTTSEKLSTGVDARNIRNIVLLRPVNQIIEFKQIVGRGTRLFEGKEFFTIYDFVDAYQRFSDPQWDGEPEPDSPCETCGGIPCICKSRPPKVCRKCGERPCVCEKSPQNPCEICSEIPCICPKKVKIKLKDGKIREIEHTTETLFWGKDGKPISTQEFMENLFGDLPNFFKDENQLREIWSDPDTRKALLKKLNDAGYGKDKLTVVQKLINAQNCDLFDVLVYIFDSDNKPITRKIRVKMAKKTIYSSLNHDQKKFIEFVLDKYIEVGTTELEQEKLPVLIESMYQSQEDGISKLGGDILSIKNMFIEFQQHLYAKIA